MTVFFWLVILLVFFIVTSDPGAVPSLTFQWFFWWTKRNSAASESLPSKRRGRIPKEYGLSFSERNARLELVTFGLGSQRSTN